MRLVLVLLFAGGTARADCTSVPQCLSRFTHQSAGTIAKIGAVMAPIVLGVGAALTLARQTSQPREAPAGVSVTPEGRLTLDLVPVPQDRYYNAHPPVEKPRHDGVFRFNDTATNVALAVGGVAVIGSIIAGIATQRRR
jgi:hypothetical protein